MSFNYFAYGSNLWTPQMKSRCPSAEFIAAGVLRGWHAIYDKPSRDGSAKLNIRPSADGATPGVLYRMDDRESERLDEAEPGYHRVPVEVSETQAVTYTYDGAPAGVEPYGWYQAMAMIGASEHGLPDVHLDSTTTPDPMAPALRPVGEAGLEAMHSILSASLANADQRYTIHPGDLSWWIYHDDPRFLHATSYWLQEDRGLLVIEGRSKEISVFTTPGTDRVPLVEWAQERRLAWSGQVGWISEEDEDMVTYLDSRSYERDATYRSYRWDLTSEPIPAPHLDAGWELRPVSGEGEANMRRAASHAAFESTMEHAMHLDRYLRFMRSPHYVPERDLVAVAPDGRVASFMVWWGDSSGVVQIEPFGTRPDFQRRGIGKALMHFGLQRMKESGFHTARVLTGEPRQATAFYESVGFEDVGRLRSWRPT